MPRPSRRSQQRLKKQLRKLGIPKPGADTAGVVAAASGSTPTGAEASPVTSNSAGDSGNGGGTWRSAPDPAISEDWQDLTKTDLNMIRHLARMGCFNERESQSLFRTLGNLLMNSKDDRARVNAFRALVAEYESHVKATKPTGPRVAVQTNNTVNLHAEADERRARLSVIRRELGIDADPGEAAQGRSAPANGRPRAQG